MDDAPYSIRAVARHTQLSPHLIRVWEKRYRAVAPKRTQTNRRRYSLEHIERLSLLRDVTRAGHSIGAIAALSTTRLRRLAEQARNAGATAPQRLRAVPGALPLLEECLEAVKVLDAGSLERTLARGASELGAQGLLQRVVAPLAQAIGELWRDGSITAAHEHFASAVIRVALSHGAQPFAGGPDSPGLVVSTPTGQLHELGALLVAATASNMGWEVTYLGASLPAAEIAGAARQSGARAVALSLVYPEDDTRLAGELQRLRQHLPSDVTLLVGGRAMPAYREALNRVGATFIDDLAQLSATLDSLRRPGRPGSA